MASRPESDESKYLAPALASITESLSLLGLSPETLAISVGESLAERYLATIRAKPPAAPPLAVPLAPATCAPPRRAVPDPGHLQLFSNDFMEYLNQIA
ncbi:hypothetical protein RR46_14085 [Papilio xuthus]|uniref:Uncharacterized protein n=1 Tax=Papilio xuthus TaxID=66420 RepID=A0A194PJG3_PAPXU|nr:hypothetical protein RR46_14085 [Papilio xuthus]